MIRFDEWVKQHTQNENWFGWGQKSEPQQAPAPQAPQAPQAKGFQLSQQDYQSARTFADSIMSQLGSVLGPNATGRLRTMRGGEANLRNALMSYWGSARNNIGANLQNSDPKDLTKNVSDILNKVMWGDI